MTGSTLFGSGKVKKHLLALNLAAILVARPAVHLLVRPFQRERGVFVIEQRRLPFGRVVALLAARVGAVARKLERVYILMAALAILRRGLEEDMPQRGLAVGRLVAVDAGDGFVRAD